MVTCIRAVQDCSPGNGGCAVGWNARLSDRQRIAIRLATVGQHIEVRKCPPAYE